MIALTLSVAQPVPPPPPPPPPPHPEDGAERVLDELLPALDVAPGVAHRELTTTAAAGDITLTGRDRGAAAVRELRVGDRVEVEYALVPDSGHEPYFAVGGSPILRDGVLVPGLDDRERAPRSAVGVDSGERHLWLVTVDGRQSDSVGATLRELASLLREMGVDDAVNLDGGGSSTLVYRAPGAPDVTIVNDPSDPSPRLVPNGIGVYAR